MEGQTLYSECTRQKIYVSTQASCRQTGNHKTIGSLLMPRRQSEFASWTCAIAMFRCSHTWVYLWGCFW